MAKRDYYNVLDVNKNSTSEQIKAAYRKQAIKHHPDKSSLTYLRIIQGDMDEDIITIIVRKQ